MCRINRRTILELRDLTEQRRGRRNMGAASLLCTFRLDVLTHDDSRCVTVANKQAQSVHAGPGWRSHPPGQDACSCSPASGRLDLLLPKQSVTNPAVIIKCEVLQTGHSNKTILGFGTFTVLQYNYLLILIVGARGLGSEGCA